MTYTCNTALIYAGLLQDSPSSKDVSTWRKSIDGCKTPDKRFIYNENYYDTSYLRQLEEGVYVPTPERAIVEYILNEEHAEEFNLIWAIQNYLDSKEYNVELLHEVADHFKLPKETLDYWIKEAIEEGDISMG